MYKLIRCSTHSDSDLMKQEMNWRASQLIQVQLSDFRVLSKPASFPPGTLPRAGRTYLHTNTHHELTFDFNMSLSKLRLEDCGKGTAMYFRVGANI